MYGEIIYSVRLKFRFQLRIVTTLELKNLVEHVIKKSEVDKVSLELESV